MVEHVGIGELGEQRARVLGQRVEEEAIDDNTDCLEWRRQQDVVSHLLLSRLGIVLLGNNAYKDERSGGKDSQPELEMGGVCVHCRGLLACLLVVSVVTLEQREAQVQAQAQTLAQTGRRPSFLSSRRV